MKQINFLENIFWIKGNFYLIFEKNFAEWIVPLFFSWIDKDDFDESTKIDPVVDEEDEKRDEEMENFEEKYNFRFEEPGSSQIMSK